MSDRHFSPPPDTGAVTIRLHAEVQAAGTRLTGAEVASFAAQIPPTATVQGVFAERGSQRDPETVLVGLAATWEGRAGTGALLPGHGGLSGGSCR